FLIWKPIAKHAVLNLNGKAGKAGFFLRLLELLAIQLAESPKGGDHIGIRPGQLEERLGVIRQRWRRLPFTELFGEGETLARQTLVSRHGRFRGPDLLPNQSNAGRTHWRSR